MLLRKLPAVLSQLPCFVHDVGRKNNLCEDDDYWDRHGGS
jgi:hypothetical protein